MRFLSVKTLLVRAAMLLIALCGSLLFVDCSGPSGRIFGQYYYDGTMYANFYLGGFPSGTIYTYTNYQVQPGTYQVTYTLTDGTFYYPGYYMYTSCTVANNSSCASYYYSSTYTVTANPGKPFFQAGADKNFILYLSWTGLATSGANAVKKLAPSLGTTTYSDGGLILTVTNKIGQLQPGQTLPESNRVGVSKK